MSNYGDYNSTPVVFLLSNLGSNFCVQTHVNYNENKDNSIMSNLNMKMRITNTFLPNFPINYTGDDYINDCYVHILTLGDYIQLVDANLEPVDLLYLISLCLLFEFY
jgi:hypothetical protein